MVAQKAAQQVVQHRIIEHWRDTEAELSDAVPAHILGRTAHAVDAVEGIADIDGEAVGFRRRHQLAFGAVKQGEAELLLELLQESAHRRLRRSEEHTSELQSLMRISYAVFC